jgi:hypothetical protein
LVWFGLWDAGEGIQRLENMILPLVCLWVVDNARVKDKYKKQGSHGLTTRSPSVLFMVVGSARVKDKDKYKKQGSHAPA